MYCVLQEYMFLNITAVMCVSVCAHSRKFIIIVIFFCKF